MTSDIVPSLPDAHQQVRLGDNQASTQKWSAAIEHYTRAIEYFQTIQNTLRDVNLKSILQAQIVECEKTIRICQLKDRFEQAVKAQTLSKKARAQSMSSGKSTDKGPIRGIGRNTGTHLRNTGGLSSHGENDSLAAMMFPNHRRNIKENSSPQMAKKTKDDSQKIEELQMSYEAMKNHFRAAMDDIERLKNENQALRMRKNADNMQEQTVMKTRSIDHDEQDDDDDEDRESENELEATI